MQRTQLQIVRPLTDSLWRIGPTRTIRDILDMMYDSWYKARHVDGLGVYFIRFIHALFILSVLFIIFVLFVYLCNSNLRFPNFPIRPFAKF